MFGPKAKAFGYRVGPKAKAFGYGVRPKAKAFGYWHESKCSDQKLRLSATGMNRNVENLFFWSNR
jgi:hypothetical protein